MGVLTQSFTEHGKEQNEAFGNDLANKITFKIDEIISNSTSAGLSCGEAAQKVDEQFITPLSECLWAEGDKFVLKRRKASIKYTSNRCEYLN